MEQKTKKPISKNLIKRLHTIYSAQGIDDEQKRAILLDLTDGRTNTTKELTYSEAMYLCGYLNGAKKENRDLTITEREIRRRRSAVLKRMQRIGIDTTDWGAVNAFCLDARIAGKKFRDLDGEELILLVPKLESILKKMADISAEQHRINRINGLLDRLDRIPGELDAIHEKLFAGNMDRNEFAKLVDRRSSLIIEAENKERELKEVYKIKL